MRRSLIHRQAYRHSLNWVVVLAMLVLTAWGLMHRVLHAGPQAGTVQQTHVQGIAGQASDHGSDHIANRLAGHDAGSSLCELLDHLSLGAAAISMVMLAPVKIWPSALLLLAPRPVHSAGATLFDARGPPVLA